MGDSQFYTLLPLKADVIHWNAIVNRLGFQPELAALRRFLARRNYYFCSGMVFKRPAVILADRSPNAAGTRMSGNRTKYERGAQ